MVLIAAMRCHHGRVDLQQMRYVDAIAREGSFTRAAEQCFVVQSALSHRVKALETELKVQLFARTSRRVELTAAGEAFLVAARESLAAAERAVADAAAATGEIRGTVTIGVIPTVTAIDVPRTLAGFRADHPAVGIRLRGASSEQLVSEVVEGRVDVALLGLPDTGPPQGVASRELLRQRLVAVLPVDHPLAARRRLRLADLADETFVDFPEGSAGRAQSDLAFAAAGLRRVVAFETMSTDLVLGLVAQALVVALLAPGVVPDRDDLRTVPVVDGPVRVEHLAWSDFNPSPAASALVRLITTGAGAGVS